MYKIHFIDKNNKRYDFCEFGLSVGESLTHKLEEVLYIVQELTPQHRNWKHDLISCGTCLFTYHGMEHVTVEYDGHGSLIVVRDR